MHFLTTVVLTFIGIVSSVFLYSYYSDGQAIFFEGKNFYMMLYLWSFNLAALLILINVRDKISSRREAEMLELPVQLTDNLALPVIAPRVFKLRMDIQDVEYGLFEDKHSFTFKMAVKHKEKDLEREMDEKEYEEFKKKYYRNKVKEALRYAQDDIGYEIIRKGHIFAYKDKELGARRYYDIQSCLSTATDIYTHMHIRNPHDRFIPLEDIDSNFLVYSHPKELSHLIWCIIENILYYEDKAQDENKIKISFEIKEKELELVIRTSELIIPLREMDEWMERVSFISEHGVEYGMGVLSKKLYDKYRIKILYNATKDHNEIILKCPKVPVEVKACLTNDQGTLDFVNQNLRDPERFKPWDK